MCENVVSVVYTCTWKWFVGVLTDELNSILSGKIHVKLEFSRQFLGKRCTFVLEFENKY